MNRTTLQVIPLLLASACAAPQAAAPAAAAPVAAATPVAPPTSSATPAPTAVAAPASTAAPAAPPSPKPLDADRVATLTGGKPETSNEVVKVSFPREDVKVTVDQWKIAPFQGLTSWAAFVPGQKAGIEAMVMGDLVLFEDEVSPVMSAALDAGLEVTALHNHFLFDTPRLLFMHIGGEGSLDQLGNGVKAALDAQRAVRTKSPKPSTSSGPAPVGPSAIDGAKLDAIFGVKGASKDGMYKATMGRKTQAECGCTVGKAMGVNTWAAFAGKDADSVVDGDFAVAESELQPVLKALRAAAIHVVAIHSHMTGESCGSSFSTTGDAARRRTSRPPSRARSSSRHGTGRTRRLDLHAAQGSASIPRSSVRAHHHRSAATPRRTWSRLRPRTPCATCCLAPPLSSGP